MDPPKDGGMPCFSGLICFLLNDDDDDGGDDGSEERRVSILNSTSLLWYVPAGDKNASGLG